MNIEVFITRSLNNEETKHEFMSYAQKSVKDVSGDTQEMFFEVRENKKRSEEKK
ncbi:hypothetical protein [Chryseobacterium sp. T16E-39]|uniref:hypothetical protein n=1 Tax=Chryseobacterium sp. T16E-39 TaxID=2015076 RepID=UPI0012FC292E|nr:hypothetical protein [Chryseobacterium sp. T16E-39]